MSNLNLEIIEKRNNREICHYQSGNQMISSHFNSVFFEINESERVIKVPGPVTQKIPGMLRIARRALRLDKCNVTPVGNSFNNIIIIKNKNVYHYDFQRDSLTKTLTLLNCRNVLHQSVCTFKSDEIFFGEYGSNPKRLVVPIHKSTDFGRTFISSLRNRLSIYTDAFGIHMKKNCEH